MGRLAISHYGERLICGVAGSGSVCIRDVSPGLGSGGSRIFFSGRSPDARVNFCRQRTAYALAGEPRCCCRKPCYGRDRGRLECRRRIILARAGSFRMGRISCAE